MDPTPFVVGFVVMSLAPLAIWATGSKAPEARAHTLLHAAVPFIAATAYLAMTFEMGDVLKPDGTVTFVARYLDWTFTTPILLSGLVLTAAGDRADRGGFLVAIVTLDVLMIVTGLFASLAVVPAVKWIWFGWSTAAFLGVLYLLWLPLRAEAGARGAALAGAYTKNLSVLTVLWVLYPVVFAIGPEGTGAVSPGVTVWAILALDIAAKVAYAFIAGANVDRALRRTA